MEISVIIPALNEEVFIEETIRKVRQHSSPSRIKEIIVADGGSRDRTEVRAKQAGAVVVQSPRGRAVQMNEGAGHASGEILYFLHADSIPPPGFDRAILQTIQEGNNAGCFRLAFDTDHILLNFYAWFTRFDVNAFRFGDQSLFIGRKTFNKIGGFREDHIVMEDNEIIRRVKRNGSFRICRKKVITSARKYREVGVLKLQMIFTFIFSAYFLGVPQSQLVTWYKRFT